MNAMPMKRVRPPGYLRRKWKVFLAWTRLDLKEVCRQSINRGLYDDFHDWPDVEEPSSAHLYFVAHRCKRCGKLFCI